MGHAKAAGRTHASRCRRTKSMPCADRARIDWERARGHEWRSGIDLHEHHATRRTTAGCTSYSRNTRRLHWRSQDQLRKRVVSDPKRSPRAPKRRRVRCGRGYIEDQTTLLTGSDPATGNDAPLKSTVSRGFSPASIVNPAVEAVEQMLEQKMTRTGSLVTWLVQQGLVVGLSGSGKRCGNGTDGPV